MKILYLAWAPYDDMERRMGGIRVYMHDLVKEVAKQGHQVVCLSSGYLFSPFTSRTWVEKDRSQDQEIASYVIVNSGIIAPAMFIENNFTAVFSHEATERAFEQFLDEQGPFDIVHIQSMEGVPYSILGLIKARSPSTRIVYSLHHYHDLCPKVDLYNERRGENCSDYDQGRNCVGCYWYDYNSLRKKYFMDYMARKLGVRSKVSYARMTSLAKKTWQMTSGLRRVRRYLREARHRHLKTGNDHFFVYDPKLVKSFKTRREQIRDVLEQYVDLFIPVSERTMEVYRKHGYDVTRFRPEYIGTKAAEHLQEGRPVRSKVNTDKALTLCFMGYPNRLKGFDVFLTALNLLSRQTARGMGILIAGRVSDHYMRELNRIGKRFHSVEVYNGYTREEQEHFLANADLGIVPPQWEDNLPQVAFEFYCHGVPFICSDLGGAQELIRGAEEVFVFQHDRPLELAKKITRIFEDRTLLEQFWEHGTQIQTMREHTQKMLGIYQGLLTDNGTQVVPGYSATC